MLFILGTLEDSNMNENELYEKIKEGTLPKGWSDKIIKAVWADEEIITNITNKDKK